MFVIRLKDDVQQNVTDKLYLDITKYNIISDIILLYDVSDKFDRNINASGYYMYTDMLENVDEDTLEDLVLDLADKKAFLILDKVDKDSLLNELLTYYGINYFIESELDLNKDITIDNINEIDVLDSASILKSTPSEYDFNSVLLRFELDKDGNITCQETGDTFNIFEKDLIHIFDYTDAIEKLLNELIDLDINIDTSTSNILSIILKRYKKSELFEYKLRLYSLMRTLSPENYSKFNHNLKEILYNYININDLESILGDKYVI